MCLDTYWRGIYATLVYSFYASYQALTWYVMPRWWFWVWIFANYLVATTLYPFSVLTFLVSEDFLFRNCYFSAFLGDFVLCFVAFWVFCFVLPVGVGDLSALMSCVALVVSWSGETWGFSFDFFVFSCRCGSVLWLLLCSCHLLESVFGGCVLGVAGCSCSWLLMLFVLLVVLCFWLLVCCGSSSGGVSGWLFFGRGFCCFYYFRGGWFFWLLCFVSAFLLFLVLFFHCLVLVLLRFPCCSFCWLGCCSTFRVLLQFFVFGDGETWCFWSFFGASFLSVFWLWWFWLLWWFITIWFSIVVFFDVVNFLDKRNHQVGVPGGSGVWCCLVLAVVSHFHQCCCWFSFQVEVVLVSELLAFGDLAF